jgi:hypothetical protein
MVKEVLEDAGEPQTANDISYLISNKFSRKIDRTSLSPQLSRLKDDILENIDGKWYFKKSHNKKLNEDLYEDMTDTEYDEMLS